MNVISLTPGLKADLDAVKESKYNKITSSTELILSTDGYSECNQLFVDALQHIDKKLYLTDFLYLIQRTWISNAQNRNHLNSGESTSSYGYWKYNFAGVSSDTLYITNYVPSGNIRIVDSVQHYEYYDIDTEKPSLYTISDIVIRDEKTLFNMVFPTTTKLFSKEYMKFTIPLSLIMNNQ